MVSTLQSLQVCKGPYWGLRALTQPGRASNTFLIPRPDLEKTKHVLIIIS